MKKKVLLRGPLLTRSGYGEQTRYALRALRSREDIFDIYLQPLQWGQTGFEKSELERPQFKGDLITSPVTGQFELWYPPHMKRMKRLKGIIVIIFTIALVPFLGLLGVCIAILMTRALVHLPTSTYTYYKFLQMS